LQGLSHRLVAVQEQERRNIACELHDEIGQMLTALKLMLDVGEATGESQQGARELARDLLERVRNLSLELRPPMLDDLGILPALVWLFNRYTTQTHIKVSFRHSGLERRFTPQIETAAYRVIQESLTNVARHAHVLEVEVRLWADEAQLQVQVEDNGQGFDLDEVLGQSGSNGLSGMRERVMLLGGELTIDSRPGAGTSLVAELPLQ
jgi:signal transduction histidine kinase